MACTLWENHSETPRSNALKRVGFHIQREGDVVTLARELPVRFDVVAKTVVPMCSSTRLAHQIRQDMWRALRNVRGFSPVVRLRPEEEGWLVEAGGRVLGRTPASLTDRITDLLEDPARRQRWVTHASRNWGGKR